MPKSNNRQFAVCVSNRGFRASLIVRRIYRSIADPEAVKRGLIRVADESGEDYLYPERLFVAIELPREANRAFRAVS